jgi:hypothetical protein
MLTVLVAQAAGMLGDEELGPDDEAFSRVVDQIVARLRKSRSVLNPVARNEDLNRLSEKEYEKFFAELTSLQSVATRANAAKSDIESADVWQESFEHMFPLPEIDHSLLNVEKSDSLAVIMPNVLVTAISRTNKSARPYTGQNKIGPIPKDCDITFEIANFNQMPLGCRIIWIVRNEGREAELVNDLGHSGQSGPTAHEHSAYKGTHYMDCVVKLNGRTVAMRRVPVTIMGLAMPPRNPRSKPTWVTRGLR